MRRILRWLIAPTRTPLAVAAAFILGAGASVSSPAWATIVAVIVVMGGLELLTQLLRRITRTQERGSG